jgi:hypothetical protein
VVLVAKCGSAHLRFSVIGQLRAASPAKGEVGPVIEALSAGGWRHPQPASPSISAPRSQAIASLRHAVPILEANARHALAPSVPEAEPHDREVRSCEAEFVKGLQ